MTAPVPGAPALDAAKRLPRNVMTTYAARVANVVGLFLLFPLVASRVQQDDYGVYLLTASFAALFTLDLGMSGASTRFVAAAWAQSNWGRLRSTVASSTIFYLAIGAVGAGLVGCALFLGRGAFEPREDLTRTALWCGLFAAIQVAAGSTLSGNRNVLAGMGRLDLANTAQLVQISLRMVLTAVVVLWAPHVELIAITDALAVIAGGALSMAWRRRVLPESRAKLVDASWADFKEMFGLMRDFMVVGLAAAVILQIGPTIVGAMTSAAEVAIFVAGQRVYQVAREVTNSLTAALLPVATYNHVSDSGEANQRLYLIGTQIANSLLFALLVPLLAFMPQFIEAWLGRNYVSAVPVALILVTSVLVNNQHLVAVPVLGGAGNLRAFSVLHVLWAVLTLVLGVLLSASFGPLGMAIAIAAPVVVLEPLYVLVALRRLSVPVRQYLRLSLLTPLWPALFLGCPMVAFVLFVPARGFGLSLLVGAAWVVLYLVVFVRWGLDRSVRGELRRKMGRSR